MTTSFTTIPAAEMSRPKNYTLSKETKETRALFDEALKRLLPGMALRVEGESPKSLRMYLRHAAQRTGIAYKAVTTDTGVEFSLAE